MAKRYLGYGYTNAQGVAKLEYDSEGNALTHSYTGVGAGKIDIVAESGTLQSETYNLLDCLFYDDGVTDTASWDLLLCSKSVSATNGKTFTCTETNASARASMNPVDNASAYDFVANPLIWEFDVVSVTGNVALQFIQQNPSINKAFNINSNYDNSTVKIEYNGSKMTLYQDGAYVNEITVTFSSTMRIGFSIPTLNNSITVKNVKVYPI